ncbi:MAG: GlsB/YeaQ/YmgE family stress response membrane protein [Pseudomonadota bacterium]|nr:GlsB/YeaQ/YmgE family stress response membrane protein [Pseudomonadota bacterium]
MNFIIWLIVGAIIGWLASTLMRDQNHGVMLNIVIGIVGAMLGGWLISPMIGGGNINSNDFSISGLVVSFLGAVILLAIVNLIRRGNVR